MEIPESTSVKGRIHSFESFSALDGPGIRYVVFLCGCPLRCLFCHNIDMVECLPGTYREYSVSEVIDKVERVRPYFNRSGGGITLSGGEPFFQFDFMLVLLREFKKRDIHTAIDSCLYTSSKKIEEISKWVDIFLVGLKHIDSRKHKELTGRDRSLILKNISYLDSLKQPFWLRYVVIPGITDNKSDIQRLAKFLSPFSYLEWVELLPYHRLGIQKWKALNKPYVLPNVEPPTREEMANIKAFFEDSMHLFRHKGRWKGVRSL